MLKIIENIAIGFLVVGILSIVGAIEMNENLVKPIVITLIGVILLGIGVLNEKI